MLDLEMGVKGFLGIKGEMVFSFFGVSGTPIRG